MNRRETLKLVAKATGVAVSLPVMTSWFTSCQTEAKQEAYDLQFFSADELGRVEQFVDLILPKTDTPSASELAVHKTIDAMLGKVLTAEQQRDYRKGFTALLQYLDGKKMDGLNADQQLALLQQLETNEEEGGEAVRTAYYDLKGKTVAYYLATEEIATNQLNYLPVPGKYQACISVKEAGGKAWAL